MFLTTLKIRYKMNKSDLVNAIAEKTGLTKADSAKSIDAFLSTVTESLQAGNSVSLIGFGTFSARERSARQGRNPQTGASIQIAASKSPAFKAGSKLRDAVKNS